MPPATTPPAQRGVFGFRCCNPTPLAGKRGQASVVPVGCGGKGWSCAAAGRVGAGREPERRRGKENAAEGLGGHPAGEPHAAGGLRSEMFVWEHNGEA